MDRLIIQLIIVVINSESVDFRRQNLPSEADPRTVKNIHKAIDP